MKQLKLIAIIVTMIIPMLSSAQNPFGIDVNDSSTTRDIYGYDSRREAKTYDYQGYTQSVLTEMPAGEFVDDKVYGLTLEQKLKNRYKADVDPSVRFKDQPAMGNCTGFLIAPNIMVTAAHCVSSDNHLITDGAVISHKSYYDKSINLTLSDWKWVFDYTADIKMTKAKHEKLGEYYVANIPVSNQYTVKRILSSNLDWDNMVDYAVLELDRPTGREPFRFRTGAKIATGNSLAMIGSPAGLPLKLADGATVTMNSGTNWFGTNLDAFGGNSGGPVYNTGGYGWIEGILVRGRIDKGQKGYYLDSACNCVKETKYENDEAKSILDDYGYAVSSMSTEVQRITGIPVKVKVRAVYENFKYAIQNNDQKRFDNWLIYSWMYTMDTAKFIAEAIGYADPVGVLALKSGRTEMFKSMVDEGMDCSLKLKGGKTMLYYSIVNNNLDALNYILKQGYNLEKSDDNGDRPIFWAINAWNQLAAEALIKNGANLGNMDGSGDKPLHAAIRTGNKSMVQLLIKNGAGWNEPGAGGVLPLKLAKSLKQKEIASYLKLVKKGKA